MNVLSLKVRRRRPESCLHQPTAEPKPRAPWRRVRPSGQAAPCARSGACVVCGETACQTALLASRSRGLPFISAMSLRAARSGVLRARREQHRPGPLRQGPPRSPRGRHTGNALPQRAVQKHLPVSSHDLAYSLEEWPVMFAPPDALSSAHLSLTLPLTLPHRREMEASPEGVALLEALEKNH